MKWILGIMGVVVVVGIAAAGAWGFGLIGAPHDAANPPVVEAWRHVHEGPVPCGCARPPR